MTTLSNQMQAKMTMRLHELRQKTLARMGETGERIKNRPQLKGDNSFSKIKHHPVMQRDDDGAMIMSFAMGIPGLNGMIETVADVALEMYGDRKATHDRPQDRKLYTPKQEASIRDGNRQDLALFMDLDDKLNTLNTYIAQGYTLGLDWNGELIPYDEIDMPTFKPQMHKPEMATNYDFAPTFHKPRPPAATLTA
jgi:hypothetical protein